MIEFHSNPVLNRPDVIWHLPDTTYSADLRLGDLVGVKGGTPNVLYRLNNSIGGGGQPIVAANGVLGVVAHRVKVDSSNNPIQPTESTIAFGSYAIYALPSIGAGIQPDAASGRVVTMVFTAGYGNIFRAKLKSGNAADYRWLSKPANLTWNSAAGPAGEFEVDPGGGAANMVTIVGLDETDPNYNTTNGGKVFFKFLPAECANILGTTY